MVILIASLPADVFPLPNEYLLLLTPNMPTINLTGKVFNNGKITLFSTLKEVIFSQQVSYIFIALFIAAFITRKADFIQR